MKRIFSIITIVLASFILSPRAAAEGAYFGVRGEVLVPVFAASGIPIVALPIFGIQYGYNFGDSSAPGFAVRASLTGLVVINRISVDALYRIPVDASEAGLYLGAGADAVLLLVPVSVPIFGAHAVIGYNFAASSLGGAFVELWPGALFSGGSPLFYISLAGGFNFRL
jgi:hypothetical protein